MKISASAWLLALCLSSQDIVRAFVSRPPLSPLQQQHATTTSLQMGYLDNLGSNHRNDDDDNDDDRGRRPDPNADMRDYLSKSPSLTNPTTASSGDYDQRRGVGVTGDQRVMNTVRSSSLLFLEGLFILVVFSICFVSFTNVFLFIFFFTWTETSGHARQCHATTTFFLL